MPKQTAELTLERPTVPQPANQSVAVVEAPAEKLPALAPEPPSLLGAIVSMASNPAVDVTKLDALLKMQANLEERDAKQEAIQAFAALSAELPRVKKNGTISLGNKGTIAFAKWEDMDAVIRPLLVKNGFTLSFNTAPRQGEGGGITVTGELMHRSGHIRTASIPLPLDAGPGRNNLQAMGSTLSYGKRYCAEMLLNIVRENQDDDGTKGGASYVTEDQVKELQTLLDETKTGARDFCQVFEVNALTEIQQGAFAAAKNMLLAKKQKMGLS